MRADPDFPISIRKHHCTSPAVLVESLKCWLGKKDTTHLIHPLGFWVVLLKRSNREEWRFHFWPAGEIDVKGMPATIHTHDRVVESRVILGRIGNTLYQEKKTGEVKAPVYEVGYGGDKFVRGTANVLRNTGHLTAVSPTVEASLKVGDQYRVGAHTYHRAVVEGSQAAATVVRMHSPSPGAPKVLGLPGYPERISFERSSRTYSRRSIVEVQTVPYARIFVGSAVIGS